MKKKDIQLHKSLSSDFIKELSDKKKLSQHSKKELIDIIEKLQKHIPAANNETPLKPTGKTHSNKAMQLYDKFATGTLMVNRKGIIEDANAHVCKLLDISIAELKNASIYDYLEAFSATAFRSFLQKIFSTTPPSHALVVNFRLAHIPARQYVIKGKLLPNKNEAMLLVFDLEINEQLKPNKQKKAGQMHTQAEDDANYMKSHYATLFEDVPLIICSFDTNGTLRYHNKIFKKYFPRIEYPKYKKNIFDYFGDAKNALIELIQSLGKEHRIGIMKQKMNNRLLMDTWLKWFIRVSLDENHNIIEYQAIGYDITELVVAERKVQQTLAKERDINELKSRFISTVSHEFRTPLSSIMTNTEMLDSFKHKLTSEKTDVYFKRIYDAVKTMVIMLEEVSTMSDDQSGKLRYEPALINIPELIDAATKEIQQLFKDRKPVHVQMQLNGNKNTLIADKDLLWHILINLLSNAFKFSHIKTEVELLAIVKKNAFLLQIRDYGIGINKKDLKHIFEPFYRGENISNIKGTGLGLSIVKRCVELHNGKIEIKSYEKKGTIVMVSIPLYAK